MGHTCKYIELQSRSREEKGKWAAMKVSLQGLFQLKHLLFSTMSLKVVFPLLI